jgi:hypothetical protein
MAEFQLRQEKWEEWATFEGAYEEMIHEIRIHVMQRLNQIPGNYMEQGGLTKRFKRRGNDHQRQSPIINGRDGCRRT